MKRKVIFLLAVAAVAVVALSKAGVFLWSLILMAGPIGSAPSQPTDELALEAKIPLGAVKGRIDHMAVDVPSGRLFISELGNDSVAVVDFHAHKLVDRIGGLKEPQGLAYAAKVDHLFIANGGNGVVAIHRGRDLARVDEIALGEDADNIRLDGSDRVIVGYGHGALAVLEESTGSRIATIPLAAHPEAFLLEPDGDRIFVNEPRALRTAVIDRSSGKEIARWNTLAAGNFPMALDATGRRLFVVYRMPAAIAAFDTRNGDVLSQRPTCADADDVFYDTVRDRVYVICGEGAIAVIDARERDLREQTRVQTRAGARTGLFVQDLDRLFVAVPARATEPAEIRIYRPR